MKFYNNFIQSHSKGNASYLKKNRAPLIIRQGWITHHTLFGAAESDESPIIRPHDCESSQNPGTVAFYLGFRTGVALSPERDLSARAYNGPLRDRSDDPGISNSSLQTPHTIFARGL